MLAGRTALVVSSVLLGMTSCGDASDVADGPAVTSSTVAPTGTGSRTPVSGAPPLPDGYVEPGRYRFVVSVDCDGVTDDPIACPDGVPDPPPIPLELTVPEGWQHLEGFPVISPLAGETDEGGLVLGWTSNTVGVQTDPCASKSHELPDVQVGPGVDDFVEAVVDQEWFHGTAPVNTTLGGASGRYFTLRGPKDISKCLEWRPWDPGFYVQGPDNRWEVWVLDVDGHRVVVVADYFPGSSPSTVAQLRQMAKSIRFTSG